jgi:anti-anti-sigma factor
MATKPPRRHLVVEDKEEVTVVRFTEKKLSDEPNVQDIWEELLDLVENKGKRKLLINFEIVEYLSSGILKHLVTLSKKLKADGDRLVLCSLQPNVRGVFEITNLTKLFRIADDEAAALQLF